eukprot:CAMPEP_0204823200 /NCGR_PEP_ID=MMETSP1346-20131115/1294_1 /ASSEMBLY_ACC=CAM_ASM_000771 /TAXON_ID=215587 /ORGANISM="Aplanochytrium stocchinoi, Strain GSBS06" /LENGTH=120 /DNA_ID=CAMNT_0051949751 /DNA_START=87 /DNA_END=449 /DNA_ORIENTATION=+
MATFAKEILEEGNGSTPKSNQRVTVSADLYLKKDMTGIWSTHKPTGFLFSADKGPQPFEYTAGVGEVIKGWDDGVATMKLNEKARITIPWQYAYGANGHPGFQIPGKADLVFEIQVLKIK